MEFCTIPNGSDTKLTKIERYGWKLYDQPGELKLINKRKLNVDHVYQRDASRSRIRSIASDWSYVACGAIIVADRMGQYFVIDGQHRVLAANSRADIELLPCIVFKSVGVQKEAGGWIKVNTRRRQPCSIDQFKAMIVSGDEDAIYLDETCKRLNIQISKNGSRPRQMKSVISTLGLVKRDKQRFDKLMILIAELCEDYPIKEKLLNGLEYIGRYLDLDDKNLRQKILSIGAFRLTKAASDRAVINECGGPRVWGEAILDLINKGKKNKYRLHEVVND